MICSIGCHDWEGRWKGRYFDGQMIMTRVCFDCGIVEIKKERLFKKKRKLATPTSKSK